MENLSKGLNLKTILIGIILIVFISVYGSTLVFFSSRAAGFFWGHFGTGFGNNYGGTALDYFAITFLLMVIVSALHKVLKLSMSEQQIINSNVIRCVRFLQRMRSS